MKAYVPLTDGAGGVRILKATVERVVVFPPPWEAIGEDTLLLGYVSLVCDADAALEPVALATVVEGRIAGTPNATTVAVATVPARTARERLSGIGASPISHCPHCFMASSQTTIFAPYNFAALPAPRARYGGSFASGETIPLDVFNEHVGLCLQPCRHPV